MNIEQLKSKHPMIYAEAIEEGKQFAVAQERARILKLLPEKSANDRENFCIKCIRDGVPLGDKESATYLSMQMKEFSKTSNEATHETKLVAALKEVLNVGSH